MPATTLARAKLRTEWVRTREQLLRRFGPALQERGFSLKHPIDVEERENDLSITQDVPGRMTLHHPQLAGLLMRIKAGDFLAIDQLYAVLLANNDDRAETLAGLEVTMAQDVAVVANYGGQTGTKEREPDEPIVDGEKVAQHLLCQKVMLLMGVVSAPL